jgi:hypothetical protein
MLEKGEYYLPYLGTDINLNYLSEFRIMESNLWEIFVILNITF